MYVNACKHIRMYIYITTICVYTCAYTHVRISLYRHTHKAISGLMMSQIGAAHPQTRDHISSMRGLRLTPSDQRTRAPYFALANVTDALLLMLTHV